MTEEETCPDRETLTAFVDGSLVDDALPSISEHLIDCQRCYDSVALAALYLSRRNLPNDVAPPWALAPAITTAFGIAVALMASLWLLLRGA